MKAQTRPMLVERNRDDLAILDQAVDLYIKNANILLLN